VQELFSPPTADIHGVKLVRHTGDLGVSVIVSTNCEALAKLEAWR
jgi:hypothetical protein